MARQVARLQRRAKLAITEGGETPECGQTEHTFDTSVVQIDGWIDEEDYEQKYSPGDTLLITSGSRDHLKIRNIHGTAECWITIKNSGGAVVFTSTTQSGLQVENCRYVHVDGAGDSPATEYGFQATAALAGDQAVFIGFRTIHFRMNNVETANTITAVGFMYHTINDAGRDYGNDPIGTPSTFSGPNTWLDEDITLSHLWGHDNGGGYYLGNNHAKRDNVPDLTNLTIFDCISENQGNLGFNFKTQTNLNAYDLTANNNGNFLNPSNQINFRADTGCSGVLHDSVGTNATGNVNHGIFLNNAWRPMEVYNMTISDSLKRSITIDDLRTGEAEDGGTVNVHDNNLTSPGEDGIRFDVEIPAAAAGSRIVDNIIEFNAADVCIDVRDLPLGTESGNTCTPI